MTNPDMISEDIQDALRGLRAILQLYPGCSIDEIVRDIKRLKKRDSEQERASVGAETTAKSPQELKPEILSGIDDLFAQLDSLSISEIEERLKSETLFPNMASLRYFASKVGIDLTARQARASSIHAIKTHFDRARIDQTMAKRSERPNE